VIGSSSSAKTVASTSRPAAEHLRRFQRLTSSPSSSSSSSSPRPPLLRARGHPAAHAAPHKPAAALARARCPRHPPARLRVSLMAHPPGAARRRRHSTALKLHSTAPQQAMLARPYPACLAQGAGAGCAKPRPLAAGGSCAAQHDMLAGGRCSPERSARGAPPRKPGPRRLPGRARGAAPRVEGLEVLVARVHADDQAHRRRRAGRRRQLLLRALRRHHLRAGGAGSSEETKP